MRYRVSQAEHRKTDRKCWAVYDDATTTQPILSLHGSKADAEDAARALNMAGVVITHKERI